MPELDDIGDLTGRKIGDYEMVARIGIGGMGVVYEGRHPLIGKRVAVKFLLPSLSKDTELVGRFISEARAVNAIGHRGIVDIFNFGVMDDGTQYFVMEFLEGRPFDQVIAKEAPMHPVLAMRYLEEILDALAAAHDAGVIHRDVKPSNIFLVESVRARPYIKLLDFGIAKTNSPKVRSTPQTRESVVIGTPEYIAPEQAQGRPVSAATDIYAVGCMAFELLTGKLPFRGENPLDTMFKHVDDPTPRVRTLVPGVPADLDALVFKMMQKLPEDRPQNVAAVTRVIEQLRGGATLDLATAAMQSAAAAAGKPIPLTQERRPPTSREAMDAVVVAKAQSPVRWVIVGTLVFAALGSTIFAIGRSSSVAQAPLVEPPPPAKLAEPAPRAVAVEPAPVVVAPALDTVGDAGVTPVAVVGTLLPKPPVAPAIKRATSSAQLKARVIWLERRLEQREAARGEALPTLRALLKQAKDDAASAETDPKRKDVSEMLDDVARELER